MTHKCPRCGCVLKVVIIQVPVYEETYFGTNMAPGPPVVVRYDGKEEVSDCARCTGGY